MSMREDCPHDNVEYDEGNYVPGFGWELRPAMICMDCGKEMEDEEVDYPGAPGPDWEDPITMRFELEDEARNPL